MAINNSMIQSKSVKTNTETVIELLSEKPNPSTILTTARPPGQLLGYYVATGGYVELYIVEASGIRLRRVG